jgi:hypothetical protein
VTRMVAMVVRPSDIVLDGWKNIQVSIGHEV